MERRKQLRKYIQRAKTSLTVERSIPIAQYGLFLALLSSAFLVILSRLFVWPYYRQVAFTIFGVVIIATMAYLWWRRIKEQEALHTLDNYFPHNELVTALSFKDDQDPLVQALVVQASQKVEKAFMDFKARKKSLFRPKAFIGLFITTVVLAVLYLFPAATQIEAIQIEKEQAVIEDMKKEVAELEKKAQTKEVKEQLQELQNTLKEAETAEEALREMVKKQKELALKEQQLKDKQTASQAEATEDQGLSKEEVEQLKELAQMQQGLTENANATQTAMSKLGKPASNSLQNAIASANNANKITRKTISSHLILPSQAVKQGKQIKITGKMVHSNKVGKAQAKVNNKDRGMVKDRGKGREVARAVLVQDRVADKALVKGKELALAKAVEIC